MSDGGADVAAWAAALAAGASAVAAFVSWRTQLRSFSTQETLAKQSIKAATFERRFQVYEDVRAFLTHWLQDGKPNIGELSKLIYAWDRSRYLYEHDVTQYIRRMWLDALDADMAQQVVSGALAGDRDAAIKLKYDLILYYGDDARMYAVFARDLSIYPPIAPIREEPRRG